MKPLIYKCECEFIFAISGKITKPVELICPKCGKRKIIEPSDKKGGTR